MNSSENWFASWFDTPWYHQLYSDRNEDEAKHFIANLLNYLKPLPNSNILDLACGKGRHAQTINSHGFNVLGLDLSNQSIASAKAKFSSKNLNFDVHDMREVYKANHFNYVFNLFTSFGYFNNPNDNQKVIESVCKSLVKEGVFVLDFMNSYKVKKNLVPQEIIQKQDIEFRISRSVQNNVIVKEIDFEAQGTPYHFEERVTAFCREKLEELFVPFNLNIITEFGDYELNEFNESTSDRLILVARKS